MSDLIARLEAAEAGSRDFTCAICERRINMRFNRYWKKDAHIAPICHGCEIWYAKGVGKPTAGTFMDRRNVRRGFAIAEALRTEAAHATWSAQHG